MGRLYFSLSQSEASIRHPKGVRARSTCMEYGWWGQQGPWDDLSSLVTVQSNVTAALLRCWCYYSQALWPGTSLRYILIPSPFMNACTIHLPQFWSQLIVFYTQVTNLVTPTSSPQTLLNHPHGHLTRFYTHYSSLALCAHDAYRTERAGSKCCQTLAYCAICQGLQWCGMHTRIHGRI